MTEPKSDAEVVEWCRKLMQDHIERTDFSAPTLTDVLTSAGAAPEMLDVDAADLTELGRFDVDLPARPWLSAIELSALRRHWVYRHRDGRVFVLAFPNRMQLKQHGFARVFAYVQEPAN